ncbi:hypothetical protein [Helicobacter sp.]|uniref:hypothetical protein n=1 Tax=Helicobacter sp. TaxID=218 RepID=UPI002A90FDF2|nr:hypothetical protein [Helicobacter sp.]MDY5556156.1 hypothetical protein [Helicobacter sp.]
MGNRCVITNKEKTRAIYQHWNGGRDSIEPLLKVAKLLGGGFDKLCEISSKVFDGEEINYEEADNDDLDCLDNGVYIINEDLEIIGREGLRYEREQRAHNLLDMVLFIYLNFRVDDNLEVRKLFDLLEVLKKESQNKKGQ